MSSEKKNINISGDQGYSYYERQGSFGIGHMSGGEIKGSVKIGGAINKAEEIRKIEAGAKPLDIEQLKKLCDQAALLGIDFESATRLVPILKKRSILERILKRFNPRPKLTNEELSQLKQLKPDFVRTRTRLLATVKSLKLSDETCQFIKNSLESSQSDSEQEELTSITKNIIIDELNTNLGVEIGLSFHTGFLLSWLNYFCILSNLALEGGQTDWFEASLETIKIIKETTINDFIRIPKNVFPGLTQNILEGWFKILEEAASNEVNNETKNALLDLFKETDEYLSVFFKKMNLV